MSEFINDDSSYITIGNLEEARSYNGVDPFPLTLIPGSDNDSNNVDKLSNWLKSSHDKIDNLLRKYSGILFRDFDIKNGEEFHKVVEALDYKGMPYVGGAAVRTQITERVFTANESPSSENIPFHHEMAQTPHPPTHLFFYCERPATTDGQTPLLKSHLVYENMIKQYPLFMAELETKGLKYVRIMPKEDDPTSAIGRGWKSTFNANTIEEAEAKLKELGSTWEWLNDKEECVKTVTAIIPAIRTDDEGLNRTNQKMFFNSLVAAYTGWNDSRNVGERAVLLGDDTPCDKAALEGACKIMNDLLVSFLWKEGDVLLLDNRTTMHSRRPFTGPRRILASLARDHNR